MAIGDSSTSCVKYHGLVTKWLTKLTQRRMGPNNLSSTFGRAFSLERVCLYKSRLTRCGPKPPRSIVGSFCTPNSIKSEPPGTKGRPKGRRNGPTRSEVEMQSLLKTNFKEKLWDWKSSHPWHLPPLVSRLPMTKQVWCVNLLASSIIMGNS